MMQILPRFLELADVAQPLAGERSVRGSALDVLDLARGCGTEVGVLVDVCWRYGRAAIAEIDLGERVHRNRPLHQLRAHADDIIDAVLERIEPASTHEGARP